MRTFAVDTAGTVTVHNTMTDAALLWDRTKAPLERVFHVASNGTTTARNNFRSRFLNRFI